ncbi:hypothetical protein [Belnapia sp. F-4-1]|uniref:hypothetical protein n=1 Tax=Belnapia sp. F-4-1 TaxID=1545443 RepID=UPI0005BA4247|nr:hypothetical protein [Belnapia sp. F-4-1]
MNGRAVIARLLTLVLLLASLLMPPVVEAAPAAGPIMVSSAAMDQDGGPDTPSRPHGILHAGSHCACQLADRLTPPALGRPRLVLTLGRATAFTDQARASHDAEPPARPPRA